MSRKGRDRPKVRGEPECERNCLGFEMLKVGISGSDQRLVGSRQGRQEGFISRCIGSCHLWLQERQTLAVGGSKPSVFSPAPRAWETVEGGQEMLLLMSPCLPSLFLFITFPKVFSALRSSLYSPSTNFFFPQKKIRLSFILKCK